MPLLLRRLRRSSGADVDASVEPTRRRLTGMRRWLRRSSLEESDWEALEELLIQADMGPVLAVELVEALRSRARKDRHRAAADLREALARELLGTLGTAEREFASGPSPQVVLMAGINGAGKTTTIAKLAHFLKTNGHGVLLAAGDTFRAGAIEQLQAWGERIDAPVISHKPGGDAGAVVYDALDAAKARKIDYVIADTAGRQHTNVNLMNELAKVRRVAERQVDGAPHEVLLVLDALTGQNGLRQARAFLDAVGISGIVLSKLDSSAKGGVAFAVTHELGIPIKFVGTGESLDDFAPFDPNRFVEALFSSDADDEELEA